MSNADGDYEDDSSSKAESSLEDAGDVGDEQPEEEEKWGDFSQMNNHRLQIAMKNRILELQKTSPAERTPIAEKELDAFANLYERYLFGHEHEIDWNKISSLPKNAVKDYKTLENPDDIKALLNQVVVIKLNGGLGTSMGCEGPKSVLSVRDGLNFLDITVQQIMNLNKEYFVSVPLVLMNSFNTQDDTIELITKYRDMGIQIYTFTQSCYPRIYEETLMPVSERYDVNTRKDAWYPPGHGDFYQSFSNSGLLRDFMNKGKKYIFVSNIDNLGAIVDPKILNMFAIESSAEFIMEVTEKTKADVKGGTLIRYDNKLHLLELAQVPTDHVEEFKSINNFKYFNTNNIWISMNGLYRVMHDDSIDLDIIVNKKTMGKDSVIQLETAIGAAMKYFKGSQGVNVPRRRFLPVKKTSDLLLVMSNIYSFKDGLLVMNPARHTEIPPIIHLGPNYSKVKDFIKNFPVIPDIVDLDMLSVSGQVNFEKGVSLKGTVLLYANEGERITIPPNTVLENKIVVGALRLEDF